MGEIKLHFSSSLSALETNIGETARAAIANSLRISNTKGGSVNRDRSRDNFNISNINKVQFDSNNHSSSSNINFGNNYDPNPSRNPGSDPNINQIQNQGQNS